MKRGGPSHKPGYRAVRIYNRTWSNCQLCSLTSSQQAIRSRERATVSRTGNLPPLPGILPDHPAPILRNQSDEREVTLAR
jgi:hypothetical protein